MFGGDTTVLGTEDEALLGAGDMSLLGAGDEAVLGPGEIDVLGSVDEAAIPDAGGGAGGAVEHADSNTSAARVSRRVQRRSRPDRSDLMPTFSDRGDQGVPRAQEVRLDPG